MLFSVSTGASSSHPSRLHVPQERNAVSRACVGNAATAHWVSWPATATTFAPFSSAPTTVPLGTDSANILSGIRYAASTSLSHAPVRASCIWLVEAIVLSHTCAPHSAWMNRSGINSSRFALRHTSGACSFTASSWNSVLMAMI